MMTMPLPLIIKKLDYYVNEDYHCEIEEELITNLKKMSYFPFKSQKNATFLFRGTAIYNGDDLQVGDIIDKNLRINSSTLSFSKDIDIAVSFADSTMENIEMMDEMYIDNKENNYVPIILELNLYKYKDCSIFDTTFIKDNIFGNEKEIIVFNEYFIIEKKEKHYGYIYLTIRPILNKNIINYIKNKGSVMHENM